jgi:hypothetical protein
MDPMESRELKKDYGLKPSILVAIHRAEHGRW